MRLIMLRQNHFLPRRALVVDRLHPIDGVPFGADDLGVVPHDRLNALHRGPGIGDQVRFPGIMQLPDQLEAAWGARGIGVEAVDDRRAGRPLILVFLDCNYYSDGETAEGGSVGVLDHPPGRVLAGFVGRHHLHGYVHRLARRGGGDGHGTLCGHLGAALVGQLVALPDAVPSVGYPPDFLEDQARAHLGAIRHGHVGDEGHRVLTPFGCRRWGGLG